MAAACDNDGPLTLSEEGRPITVTTVRKANTNVLDATLLSIVRQVNHDTSHSRNTMSLPGARPDVEEQEMTVGNHDPYVKRNVGLSTLEYTDTVEVLPHEGGVPSPLLLEGRCPIETMTKEKVMEQELTNDPPVVTSWIHCSGLTDLKEELKWYERHLQEIHPGKNVIDQCTIYHEITTKISGGARVRMMIQASAGTGKYGLLTTLHLWCLVNRYRVTAVFPTDVAAATMKMKVNDIDARTFDSLFDMDIIYNSELDIVKGVNPKAAVLSAVDVLVFDEVSMIDIGGWNSVVNRLSALNRAGHFEGGLFGELGKMRLSSPLQYFVLNHTLICHENEALRHIIIFNDIECPGRRYACLVIDAVNHDALFTKFQLFRMRGMQFWKLY